MTLSRVALFRCGLVFNLYNEVLLTRDPPSWIIELYRSVVCISM